MSITSNRPWANLLPTSADAERTVKMRSYVTLSRTAALPTLLGLVLTVSLSARSYADDPPKPPVNPTPTPAPVVVVVVTPPSAVVKVTPDGPVTPGTLVTIDASGSTGQDVDIDFDADADEYKPDSNGRLIYYFPKTTGKFSFRVTAESIIDGAIKKKKEKGAVVVQPPVTPTPVTPVTPVAPVTPTPVVPTPAVVPFAGALNALLIWDTANDEPPTTLIRNSTVKTSLAGLNTAWFVETKLQATPKFDKLTAAAPPPAVYFLDATGHTMGVLPIAAGMTDADVVAKTKAIRAGSN